METSEFDVNTFCLNWFVENTGYCIPGSVINNKSDCSQEMKTCNMSITKLWKSRHPFSFKDKPATIHIFCNNSLWLWIIWIMDNKTHRLEEIGFLWVEEQHCNYGNMGDSRMRKCFALWGNTGLEKCTSYIVLCDNTGLETCTLYIVRRIVW